MCGWERKHYNCCCILDNMDLDDEEVWKENIIMLLRLSEKQPQQFRFIKDKNGSIHKQVGKQRT